MSNPALSTLVKQMEADLKRYALDLLPVGQMLIEKYRDALLVVMETTPNPAPPQPLTPHADERQWRWQETQDRLQREKLAELQVQAQREEHGPRMLPCEGGPLDAVLVEVGVDAPEGAYLPFPDHLAVYQLRGNSLVYSEEQTQRYRDHLQARLT